MTFYGMKVFQKFHNTCSTDVNNTRFSLSLDSSLTFAATGQIGKEPYICIWDTTNQKTVSILKDIGHSSGVGVIAFSPDSQVQDKKKLHKNN